jgi:hypothetical protein
MKSAVLQLPPGGASPRELLAGVREAAAGQGAPRDRAPSFVLAFLSPGSGVPALLESIAGAFPKALCAGCEAVTQFAGGSVTSAGTLQLFWFERAGHGVELTVIRAARGEPFDERDLERVGAALGEADAAFLLGDGLRFPSWELLDALRDRLPNGGPPAVGGLASQLEPILGAGARVFTGREVLDSACIVGTFRGVEMAVEIVRGWDPASPIFTVTDARGDALLAIDGEPAPAWYRRFFTVDGELAPMPESAHRFPLIVDGPRPERRNLYRSMKRFDEAAGAVVFWGDLEVGDRVRLGMGNDASLLRTAARLPSSSTPEAAVLFSCVGREVVLGDLAEREVATIHEALGGASLAGFFTFGEIGPAASGVGSILYNQTAVLALLRERAA